jgi:3'-5' exoribonuclease
MLEQNELTEISSGEAINHFLLLTKFEEKTTRAGKSYLDLELSDKSARLPAKMWDNIYQVKNVLEAGIVVKVVGTMDTFNDQFQIKVEKISAAKNEDHVSVEDLMPKSVRDLSEMKNELDHYIKSVKEKHLHQLLKIVLTGEYFERYIKVPAGKAWHHAYVHGLLEHTLEIVKICEMMCGFHPELNRDLLITAAILHDFGKTEELSTNAAFDYTDKGKLIGHIVIAAIHIENKAKEIKGFPDDLKHELIHLVLSHQGKLEHASPVEPKTIEAIALYHADELSAKTNAYINAVKAEKTGESAWTRFLPLAGTALMIPKKSNDDEFNETLF